jgi:hypothetical protein
MLLITKVPISQKNCTKINWNLDIVIGIVNRRGDGRPISCSPIPGRGKKVFSPKNPERL